MDKIPEKYISKKNNISSSSTNRILDSISKDNLIKNNGKNFNISEEEQKLAEVL